MRARPAAAPEGAKPIRVLWVSESPTALTGFGTVTRELLVRLAAGRDFEVAAVAWGYDGWPYDRKRIPYDLYPSQKFGQDILEKAIVHFRPDVVVGFGDLWMLDWLKDFDLPPSCRLVIYFPLDGEPFPGATRRLIASADVAISCSLYGAKLTADANPDARVGMIYHGVDCRAFRPLRSKEEVKRRQRLTGKFVVGCVARNQPRKNFPGLVRAFARFAAAHDDAMLYLHTAPRDAGWDLVDLTRRFGIETRTAFSRFATIGHGYDSGTMNEIYNFFDVMALPSTGEGFGMPLLEAMAAGTPVITTDFSAAAELVRGRGELIAVKEIITVGRYNIDQAIPDTDDLVACLERLYADPALRARHRRAGLQFARQLDWKWITPQWQALLHDVVRGSLAERPVAAAAE